MWSSSLLSRPIDHPYQALIIVFVAWKSILIAVAACSPGSGYDTSTFPFQLHEDHPAQEYGSVATILSFLSAKLTKWDAIYFTTISNRGYLYEQEWAFGWGFTRVIAFFSHDLRKLGFEYGFLESFVGISIAHASHFLAVLALYNLAKSIFPGPSGSKMAFIAACLHVISPAGLFLSAPYSESTFAFLNFLGCLLFAKSFGLGNHFDIYGDAFLAASGLILGTATTMRGNGLLNGLIFLEEAFRLVFALKDGLKLSILRRLLATGFGGLCIAVGFLAPQYIAYEEFCVNHTFTSNYNHTSRVWCERQLPSIYSFVQDYYWNVGFLRYYTISNVPLFILASPMLTIMTMSCFWTVEVTSTPSDSHKKSDQDTARVKAQLLAARTNRLLHSLAVPQLLLAFLTLTTYHVQIITRISSGYPVWYLWTASMAVEPEGAGEQNKSARDSFRRVAGTPLLRFMMIYALVQGGLFASFLPPA